MDHTSPAAGRSALVTGTSTGIGQATVLRLVSQGVNVFAGVRRAADGEALAGQAAQLPASDSRGKGQVFPLMLDVANDQSIQQAVDQVREKLAGAGLWALVHNAGVVVGGPAEVVSAGEWRRQFDINFFGVIELTRLALPLLRQAVATYGPHVPRLLLISSIGGRVAQPLLAPYTCSKWAATALGDSLRLELRRQRIGVTVIEPGAIATPIWDKGETTLSAYGPEHSARRLYGPELEGLGKAATQAVKTAIPPEEAARAIVDAMYADRAPARVLVGRDAKIAALLKRFLPTSWFDTLLMRQFSIANLPPIEPQKLAT